MPLADESYNLRESASCSCSVIKEMTTFMFSNMSSLATFFAVFLRGAIAEICHYLRYKAVLPGQGRREPWCCRGSGYFSPRKNAKADLAAEAIGNPVVYGKSSLEALVCGSDHRLYGTVCGMLDAEYL